MKKILIANPFGIGDVLFSTVLIGVVKDNFPQTRIFYIANKRTSSVLEASPDLKKVFVFDKGDLKLLWKESKRRAISKFFSLLGQVRKEKIDLAFDLSMGHEYGLVFKLLGIRRRIGFNFKNRGRFLTDKLEFDGFNDKPIAEYYLDLARIAGLRIKNPTTKIWLGDREEDIAANILSSFRKRKDSLLFGIAPGGGVSFGKEKISFKRWDAGNFAELADKLIEGLDGEVIFMWGPGEEGLIKGITGLMKNKAHISPPTTITEMAALMKRCDAVITNDSGPLHVARAAGARTISIFGPSNELVYGPYPPSTKHLVVTKDIECRPCYKKFKLPDCASRACLRQLSTEKVFQAIVNYLRHCEETRSADEATEGFRPEEVPNALGSANLKRELN